MNQDFYNYHSSEKKISGYNSCYYTNFKSALKIVGLGIFIAAVIFLYSGLKELSEVRPSSDYEDKGIYTFSPYQVFPVQLNNNATGRSKRLNPKKTVYMVYYKTTDKTRYQWKRNMGSSRTSADKILAEGEEVQRRVLIIKNENKYITVDSKLTAEKYVERLRIRFTVMVSVSAVYIAIYIIIWLVISRRRRRE